MIEAVIFDIDGTLVDSNELHATCWQEAFERFGIRLPFDEVRKQIGKGGDQLIPSLLSEEQAEVLGKEIEEFRSNLWKKKYLSQVKPLPGVRALFERLIGEGKKIALASSAKGDELKTYKRIANITDLVDEQTSSDDADKSKPHPDIFEAALERLAVASDHAIAIGDTPYDAIACARAHLRCIGVETGGWNAEQLRLAGAVEVFASVQELGSKYEKSALAEAPLAA